jgi:aspartyl-tRNA(Asn)/glutamyl-tRNA(Gln) amidotransferase subunit A
MNDTDDLFFAPAGKLRQMIAEKSIGCARLTETFLKRIEALNPSLNAFQFIDFEGALDYAQVIDRKISHEESLGELGGIPVIVPDALYMQNTPTTFGSRIFESQIDSEDSIEIALLKKAGAVILGKATLSEFGLSYETANLKGEMCRNPWNTAYSPGGGGGGTAAAVAAGLSPFALGADFNGSLRMTAGFCGLPGLIPTRGRVPTVRKHLLSFTERMFYRKGIISRNIRDMAILLNVLAKSDSRDPQCCCDIHHNYEECLQDNPSKLKIAYSPDLGFIPVSQAVKKEFESGLDLIRSLGHHVEQVSSPINRDVLTHFMNLFTTDRYLSVMKFIDDHPESYNLLMDNTKEWLQIGHSVTGPQYSLGISYMGELIESLGKFLQAYDLFIAPTVPTPPFLVGCPPQAVDGQSLHPRLGLWSFLVPFNMSGHPCMTLPCGYSPEGLPISMQIIGREFSEGLILAFSHQLEKRRPFARPGPEFL